MIADWFHVKNTQELKGVPMFVQHEVLQDASITHATETKLTALLDDYKEFATRTNFAELWRNGPPAPTEPKIEDGTPAPKVIVKPQTKMEKLVEAMSHRLPSTESKEFLNKLQKLVEQKFKVESSSFNPETPTQDKQKDKHDQ